ncbi:MAG: NAD-dependent epimerase/dehydratase family protein [Bryobacteraceae bacterium]
MIAASERELDDFLARPNKADIEAMRALDGDLMILGVAGKMGPGLARRARCAADAAGVRKRVIGVSRFSNPGVREALEAAGIEMIAADLLEAEQLAALPDAVNVVFMAARKFGTSGAEYLTWAMNAYLPALVAGRFRDSKIVAFSSGDIYPPVPVAGKGATENTPPAPAGEYAQSVLARESMFEYFSDRYGTRAALLRLNHAVDLRYGVLLDIGRRVFAGEPVDLSTGMVNAIWQGDANSVCLRSFALCGTPPAILNVAGAETLSTRWIAGRFGQIFGKEPVFAGTEGPAALLVDGSRCHGIFGFPEVSAEQMIEWTASWIGNGGPTWG